MRLFYRRLRNNYRHWFPRLPDRTRLFRLLAIHNAWTEYVLGDPPNQKACKRGTWSVRMMVDTVLSLLTGMCHLKKVSQCAWAGLQARLAYTMVLFNDEYSGS